MGRGSRGGGGQAVEEVISPQLAPLPRSMKGRRKPPGPPPVVPSPQQPGISLRHTRADASSGYPAIHSGHAYSQSTRPRLKVPSPTQPFLKCTPSLTFPICTMELRASIYLIAQSGFTKSVCPSASAWHTDCLQNLWGYVQHENTGPLIQKLKVSKHQQQSI